MATFDANDFGARVTALFPWRRWASFTAVDVTVGPIFNGRLGALLYGLASQFPIAWNNLQYVKGEERFLTMTDTADQAGLDLFAGVVARLPLETYHAYAGRLILTLTAGCPSIPGLTKILQAYLNAFNLGPKQTESLAADVGQGSADNLGAADRVLPQSPTLIQPLGADVGQGGADHWGFADEPGPGLTAPAVYVFDHTSDPATCALLGITDPQFGVALLYPGISTNVLKVGAAITPAFDLMVRTFKGPGFIPVYCSNGP